MARQLHRGHERLKTVGLLGDRSVPVLAHVGLAKRPPMRHPEAMPQLSFDADGRNPHDPGSDAAGERAAAGQHAASLPTTTPAGTTIRIGTASWTDPTMTAPGVFYPRGVESAEERLAHYAGTFPIVAVDATYYALPSARVATAWVERTPPDFIFDVKAHALMTGQPTETKRLPKDLRSALSEDLAAKPRLYARDLPTELRDEVRSEEHTS